MMLGAIKVTKLFNHLFFPFKYFYFFLVFFLFFFFFFFFFFFLFYFFFFLRTYYIVSFLHLLCCLNIMLGSPWNFLSYSLTVRTINFLSLENQ